MPPASDSQVQSCLVRFNAGDPAAREQLFALTDERLRLLARKLLRVDFPRLAQFEETDDVLQIALLRLLQALKTVKADSAKGYFCLAARELRRTLLDLTRRYAGPRGAAPPPGRDGGADPSLATPSPAPEDSTSSNDPSRLAAWTELHECVASLPDDERDVFDLLWYEGLTQREAADVLGVAEATVKRRWLRARRRLCETLDAEALGF